MRIPCWRPATRVKVANAPIRRVVNHRVIAANAGGYNTPDIAAPASTQPAKKITKFGAVPTTTRASAPNTDPAVITRRGPCRSINRPTGTPAKAETTNAEEKAAVTISDDQPVSALINGASTGKV